MAARKWWKAEALSEASTTSSSYSDLVSLTLPAADQVAGATYAVFWSLEGTINSASSDYRARLLEGASTVRALVNQEAQETASPPDYHAHGGMVLFTAHATTPVDATFKLQHSVETATSTTGKSKTCRISILKLEAGDEFASDDARSTSTDFSPNVTTAELDFTPGTPGDYVVIASAILDITGTGACIWRISHNGDDPDSTLGIRAVKDATEKASSLYCQRYDGLSGAQTFGVDFNSDQGDGATAGIQNVAIIALRVDGFDNVYGDDGVDSVGTDTSYVVGISDTFTPAANPHLVVGGARLGGSSNTISSYCQLNDGGTIVGESIRENTGTSPTSKWGMVAHHIETYAASSRTVSIERKSENSSNTVSLNTMGFAVFDLGASSISGSASITEPIDTLSGAGSTTLSGAASITEPMDTLSAAGKLDLAGAASITEPMDTLSSTAGAPPIEGAASITEAMDTLSGAGSSTLSGAASITEPMDTLSSTATRENRGAASITEPMDTCSAAGVLAIAGVVSITEPMDTATAAGQLPIGGVASGIEAMDTIAAAGALAIVAVASITEPMDTLSAEGILPPEGRLAEVNITEPMDTLSAAGATTLSGAASINEPMDTLTAAGAVVIFGGASINEAMDTCSAVGTSPLTGAASINEANDNCVATGFLVINGGASINEPMDTLTAVGGGRQLIIDPLCFIWATQRRNALLATQRKNSILAG